ncbi:hypothetical protein wTkk_000267 [Wolbachia endosymbiont of Trichogramma kaykai]
MPAAYSYDLRKKKALDVGESRAFVANRFKVNIL